MRSPSIYAQCDQVYRGYAIPDINYSPIYSSEWNYGNSYNYAYTSVNWKGFQRANFTALQPQWLNATKISMLGSCAANATCTDLYDAFSDTAADATLNAYILAAITDIASVLPDGGNKTWDPSTSLAHTFSTLTTMANFGNELFGLHNGFALSVKSNPNVTESQLEAAFSLAVYLSGGDGLGFSAAIVNHFVEICPKAASCSHIMTESVAVSSVKL